ncbi:EF-hand domain-containing protein [Bythopirellula goksoeyrii]|uniref:EF hand n=1 Tax=Bythopirellula goksoeyrii TaxID=1400387 RepID=A0A5B9QE58_9BACT|nr:EF-hand domain-containing protein [Bythopirellula goksoeyrii]QEG35772.1 EF hand [Bythopirellula goksoeyrii]
MSALICNRQLVVITLLAPLLSCGGSGASNKPGIDPGIASAKAFELLDKNSDGLLNDAELQGAPGLAEGKSRADTNGDGQVSQEELASRIKSWNDSILRLVGPELEVQFNGRLVPGATIIIEPESFLSEWIEPKTVSTNEHGKCTPQISRELPGMNMGYYRIKVSKEVGGKERIPKKYNEQTQVGVEFCPDRPSEEYQLIEIHLGKKSRRR